MLLFLLSLITSAHAETHTCSIRDISLNGSMLARYAADSARLPTPKLFRTEANPEFAPDNPTTFWALPTAGTTVAVKVHHATATSATSKDLVAVIWVDTVVTIDPATELVSGTDECDVLHPVTQHVLEILKVIQEPGAPK